MFIQQKKIFLHTLQLVCEECGITPQELVSSRNRKASGARAILVQVLSPYIDDQAIASELGRSRQGICYIRNNFTDNTLLASFKQVVSKLNLWQHAQS